MAEQGGGTALIRDYRKGNWTVAETMVLIEAKKMDDERRLKRTNDGEARGKPTELRWKWVEDYCWRKGCFRSQNQCNDKWDNLMRDYKKVRDYERKLAENGDANGPLSYRKLEKNERKERNLPTNLLIPIYDALVAAVERRGPALLAASSSSPNPNLVGVHLTSPISQHHAMMEQHRPPPADSENTSGYSNSPAKRRRTSGGGGGEGSSWNEMGNTISRSATVIAEAIHARDEMEERRHRELMSAHERRLRMEETKLEMRKQGMSGLIDCINNLADSIRGLASQRNRSSPTH